MSVDFTHLDDQGRASMVDVTGKPVTLRRAVARCRVTGTGLVAAFDRPAPPGAPTDVGDVLAGARVAGIMGGMRTSSLVPLCHPIPITELDVTLELDGDDVDVVATAETVSRTGIEMEALTACAMAALAVLHDVLEEHPEAAVGELTLWSKTGGRSGTWHRVAPGPSGMRADPVRGEGDPPGTAGPGPADRPGPSR